MASLIQKIVNKTVSGAVQNAVSTAKSAASAAGKTTTSSGSTTAANKTTTSSNKTTASSGSAASTEGVTSQFDRQFMSEEDLQAVQNFSAAAKSASAAGDQAGVTSAHAAAEAIRAKYGYSGGQLGDQYIPLEGAVSVAAPKADTSGIRDTLEAQMKAAGQQQTNAIDYATALGITALEQAQAETEEQLQSLRDQTDLDERKALDNQALYAEVRGDRGGVGREQYDSIQNTAAQNRLAVNRQQVELAAETKLQMEQLRAQGEFEKADALLQLSQSYLAQLAELEQWAAEYNLDSVKVQAGLDQWRAEFGLEVGELLGSYNGQATLAAQKQQTTVLAEAGQALLKAGIVPSAAQLTAMGMTESQARAQISAQKAASAAKSSSSKSSASQSNSAGKSQDYEGLFTSARGSFDARSYIANNYKAFGFTASSGLWDAYQTWLVNQTQGNVTDLTELEGGGFRWRGTAYSDLTALLRAIDATNLTKAEAAALEQRLAELGYDDLLLY